MREGWFEDYYLIIFDEDESLIALKEYGFELNFQEYKLIGLIGWDDFILFKNDQFLIVPTAPTTIEYLSLSPFQEMPEFLEHDESLNGNIKWYTTPLIFGGDPSSEENISWVNHKQHRELVVFWNNQYKKSTV